MSDVLQNRKGWTDASRRDMVERFLAANQVCSHFAKANGVSASALADWVRRFGPNAVPQATQDITNICVVLDDPALGALEELAEKLVTTFGFRPTPAQTVLHLIKEYAA